MTREDIIRMADASGLSLYGMGKDREQFIDYLECFADLVASAEREECAKVCESIDMEAFGVLPVRTVIITSHCAEAIRARG